MRINNVCCCCFIFSCLALSAANVSDNMFNPLWPGQEGKVDKTQKTWKQSGTVGRTFDATKRQVETILKSNGFTEEHGTDPKKNSKKSWIGLWSKDETQIIVMLVEKEISETIFSWGVTTNGK